MVIMWILGLVLAVGVLLLVIAVSVAIVKALIELTIRLVLAAGLAVTCGGAVGLAATQWDSDGLAFGFIAALLAFVPALMAVWSWRRSGEESLGWAAKTRSPATSKVDLTPIEQALGLEGAAGLAAAWDDAQRMAPREPLAQDREACARFLGDFEAAADCDPVAIDLATFIRRHVPGLVSETRIVADGADADERREAIKAMVAGLRQVGHDAREVLEGRHRAALDRLAIRQQRFALRDDEQREWR